MWNQTILLTTPAEIAMFTSSGLKCELFKSTSFIMLWNRTCSCSFKLSSVDQIVWSRASGTKLFTVFCALKLAIYSTELQWSVSHLFQVRRCYFRSRAFRIIRLSNDPFVWMFQVKPKAERHPDLDVIQEPLHHYHNLVVKQWLQSTISNKPSILLTEKPTSRFLETHKSEIRCECYVVSFVLLGQIDT